MASNDIVSADELESIMMFAYSVAFKLFVGLFAFHAAIVTGSLPYALSLDTNYNCGSQFVVKSSALVMSGLTLMFLATHLFVYDELLLVWGHYKRSALKEGRFKMIRWKLSLITIFVVCVFAIIAMEVRFAWRVNHFRTCRASTVQVDKPAAPLFLPRP